MNDVMTEIVMRAAARREIEIFQKAAMASKLFPMERLWVDDVDNGNDFAFRDDVVDQAFLVWMLARIQQPPLDLSDFGFKIAAPKGE